MGGLDLLVVDYLQLISAEERHGRSRAQQVGTIAWELKLLSMDLGCPVLLLSQLNREGAKEAKPPSILDLKESGDIENHSSVVWLLYRPPNSEAAEVWLRQAKNRDGVVTRWKGLSALRLAWDAETATFTDDYYEGARPNG